MKYFLTVIFVLVSFFGFASTASATAYAMDNTNGRTCGVGTASSTAFCTLRQFTEVARSAGDVLFVRRIATTTTAGRDTNFTSSGTLSNPIFIEADLDNIWGDFSTSSQTATVAVGSTTIIMSASTTGIVSGDWIYVEGDCRERQPLAALPTTPNGCAYSYEVRSVTSQIITLWIPYKGISAGSGKYLRVMPRAPQHSISSADFQLLLSADSFWDIRGMHFLGTDTNGVIQIGSGAGFINLQDLILEGNAATARGLGSTGNDGWAHILLSKSRVWNNTHGIYGNSANTFSNIIIRDCFISANSAASSYGIWLSSAAFRVFAEDVVLEKNATADIGYSSSFTTTANESVFRNVKTLSATTFGGGGSFDIGNRFYFEDEQGVSQRNVARLWGMGTSSYAMVFQSTTTETRSSGGSSQNLVAPNAQYKNVIQSIKLFDYPVYTDTTSRTYSVYFRNATSTASSFSTNPTNEELWIECYYWNFPTSGTSTRYTKKSTGTINFTGSNDWQALSVTCQPTTAGILYLRGYYGKTKETGRTNQFLVDNFVEKS